jgi:hypothetical protein
MFSVDSREGDGEMVIEGVEDYVGKFSGNKKNGRGVMTDIENGQIYEGMFLNDQKHDVNGKLTLTKPYYYEIKGSFRYGVLISGDTVLPTGE